MLEMTGAKRPRAQVAVEILKCHLDAIPHPEVGVLRLVQFSHSSPGLDKLRRQLSEGIVSLLEDNGMLIFNGVDEAIADLRSKGFSVEVAVPAEVIANGD